MKFDIQIYFQVKRFFGLFLYTQNVYYRNIYKLILYFIVNLNHNKKLDIVQKFRVCSISSKLQCGDSVCVILICNLLNFLFFLRQIPKEHAFLKCMYNIYKIFLADPKLFICNRTNRNTLQIFIFINLRLFKPIIASCMGAILNPI